MNRHVGSPVAFGRVKSDLATILGSFVFVNKRELFVQQPTGRQFNKTNFNDYFMRYVDKPMRSALASRLLLQVSSSEYKPGVNEPFVASKETGMVLNTWRPSDLLPDDGGAKIVLNHLEYLLPNDDEREHFLDVLAHAVQKPDEKITHCVMFIGGQGTGKSWLGDMVSKIFGRHNTIEVDNQALTSQFNARIANKQAAVIEEVGLDDRVEAYNRMKTWITQETIPVEEKFEPRYDAITPRLIIGFSNRELPLKIEEGDRRFMFVKTPDAPRDKGYYDTLFSKGLDEAGRFLGFLLKRDISRFSPKAHAPMTDLKKAIVGASRPAVENEIGGMIEANEYPFNQGYFSLADLRGEIQVRVPRNTNQSSNELARVLRKFGYEKVAVGQVRIGNRQLRFWARRSSELINASSEEIRKSYLAFKVV